MLALCNTWQVKELEGGSWCHGTFFLCSLGDKGLSHATSAILR